LWLLMGMNSPSARTGRPMPRAKKRNRKEIERTFDVSVKNGQLLGKQWRSFNEPFEWLQVDPCLLTNQRAVFWNEREPNHSLNLIYCNVTVHVFLLEAHYNYSFAFIPIHIFCIDQQLQE
jgi:hypothetical protein